MHAIDCLLSHCDELEEKLRYLGMQRQTASQGAEVGLKPLLSICQSIWCNCGERLYIPPIPLDATTSDDGPYEGSCTLQDMSHSRAITCWIMLRHRQLQHSGSTSVPQGIYCIKEVFRAQSKGLSM